MRPLLLAFALTLPLAACPRSEPDNKPTTGPSVEALLLRAEEDGYLGQEGSFQQAQLAFCCEALVDCLAIDAADHLGTLALPPSPQQERPDVDMYWMWGQGEPGLSRDFRLRPDEAIVWMGRAPPQARYAAFLAQVSTRAAPDKTRYRVQGALGPALELTHAPDAPLIVVLAPDRAVDSRVRAWLAEAGYPLDTVRSLPFSTALARLGLEADADTFLVSVQVLDPVDQQALVAWWQDPETTVLRLSPDAPEQAPVEPWPSGYFPLRGTGTDESELEQPMDALRTALFAHFQGWLPASGTVTAQWRDPVRCLSDLDCDDVWPARLRSESEPFYLEQGAALLVFGVNHARTGKSSAGSVSVIAGRSDAGVATFAHTQMVSSARPFLGEHERVDDLYAVLFARDCSALGQVPCVEVPSTCPGPDLDSEMYLQFDDWLDPITGAAPLETELLLPRTIKLFPLP